MDLQAEINTALSPLPTQNVEEPKDSPLRQLIERGQDIDLKKYARLGEHQIWTSVDGWTDHTDLTLADLSKRLLHRKLPKTVAPRSGSIEDLLQFNDLMGKAKERAISNCGHIDRTNVDYYVCMDQPNRTSYKRYDWKPDSWHDSIWIVSGDKAEPIEDHEQSTIIQGLKDTRYFPRIMMPAEVRDLLDN